MKMEISLVLVIVIIVLAWKVLNWVWFTPKRLERCLRKQGLAGNPYRLFSGDWKENSMMVRQANSKPVRFSHDIAPRLLPLRSQCIDKYGKNSFVWVGPMPTVNIMNPEQLKDILSKIDDYPKTVVSPFARVFHRGITSLKGEKWAQRRKLVNPAFHLEKLKNMLPAFWLSCSGMVGKWEELVSIEGRCELDVWPYLVGLTSDVISRAAFGSSHEEGRKVFELQKEQAKLLMETIRAVYVPGWRFLPTKMSRKLKTLAKDIETSLWGIIRKREEAMKSGKAANDDLLGIMMESNMKAIEEHGKDKKVGISMGDVIEECKLFYFAGQETTSNLLVWTMVLLSKHQEWQERAREEVLQVFENKKPDFDRLSQLKVVTMILYEVLRLYPPVIELSRTAHKETKLGGLSLPAGVGLSLPIILLHRNPEFWGNDAKEFKPERFSEGIAKATKGQLSFLPFGWGPRKCLGQNFALTEAKLALAMILQRFTFELSPSYAHAPTQVLTLRPQYGAHIVLRKHK